MGFSTGTFGLSAILTIRCRILYINIRLFLTMLEICNLRYGLRPKNL